MSEEIRDALTSVAPPASRTVVTDTVGASHLATLAAKLVLFRSSRTFCTVGQLHTRPRVARADRRRLSFGVLEPVADGFRNHFGEGFRIPSAASRIQL